ncbi:hypothetical protein AURDEDRAFT_131213 [Auricularia subglabra TFB-10046 SS5]|uniref:C3H1-type domain-containing protein n=1 Tax=Auricularia subglabra (strain TFB-10046 / SS5) TaxID=717982 RepID=J0D677_AURST|nr:hypothetical protein AURDEDRAFT_131213 [Auricularia subglabra TFB-10046 SS5]
MLEILRTLWYMRLNCQARDGTAFLHTYRVRATIYYRESNQFPVRFELSIEYLVHLAHRTLQADSPARYSDLDLDLLMPGPRSQSGRLYSSARTELTKPVPHPNPHQSSVEHPASPPPSPACRFFALSKCKKGVDCPFRHDASPTTPELSIPGLQPPRLASPTLRVSPHSPPVTVRPKGFGSLRCQLRDSIAVEYGPGFDILNLALLGDPATVTLTGLPSGTSAKQLWRALRAHGSPLTIEILQTPDDCHSAVLSYSNNASAKKGATVLGSLLRGAQATVTSPPGTLFGPFSLCTTMIKLVWNAPTQSAVLAYDDSESAHLHAAALTGRVFDGRRLSAYYCDEHIKPSVVVPDLPLSIPAEDLRAVAQAKSIKFETPSYRVSDAHAQLDLLLRQFGTLESFVISKYAPGDGKLRAVATFSQPEHVDAAIAALHGKRQLCVGASRVWFHRLLAIDYVIPVPHYAVISPQIHDLRGDSMAFSSLRVFEPSGRPRNGSVTLSIRTDDIALFAQLKVAVEKLMRGRVLRDAQGRNVWDSHFFVSGSGQSLALSLNALGKVFVVCDAMARRVRVCGSNSDIQSASEHLLDVYNEYSGRVAARTDWNPSPYLVGIGTVPLA